MYMHIFDYGFLQESLLPAQLVNLTANISALKTLSSVRKGQFESAYGELERIAKIESVKASNATPLSLIFRDNLSRIFTRPPKTLGEKYFRAGSKPVETFRPSRPGLRPRHENRRRGGCFAAETTQASRGSTGERTFNCRNG